MFKVEVVYCPQDKNPFHQVLEVSSGTTVEQVLLQSNLYNQYPETKTLAVGIFSKKVSLQQGIRAGDRIEVYRKLRVDPMEKRRLRANKKAT